jgi:hypothetical protein
VAKAPKPKDAKLEELVISSDDDLETQKKGADKKRAAEQVVAKANATTNKVSTSARRDEDAEAKDKPKIHRMEAWPTLDPITGLRAGRHNLTIQDVATRGAKGIGTTRSQRRKSFLYIQTTKKRAISGE